MENRLRQRLKSGGMQASQETVVLQAETTNVCISEVRLCYLKIMLISFTNGWNEERKRKKKNQ